MQSLEYKYPMGTPGFKESGFFHNLNLDQLDALEIIKYWVKDHDINLTSLNKYSITYISNITFISIFFNIYYILKFT
jgi:hypothetical protein